MGSKNIGFVSTRFAGVDGVTMEASKWAKVLEDSGHHSFWFAGELDREPE
ncbi:MAG: glycosyltransferase family 1 protein, partial [Deltaproteobacteria bacterium]|nr:glycosyltransferase family 1 protein [Deltaproteobacteria bacterium]